MAKISINCACCGKVFTVYPSRLSRGTDICCSVACAANRSRSHAENNVACSICGKKFHVKPSHLIKLADPSSITCSKKCFSIAQSVRMTGERNHQYGLAGELNASHKSDGYISALGYAMVRNLTHPLRESNDFMFVHRLVVEEYLREIGDYSHLVDVDGHVVLDPSLVVHHVDGNKLNNTIGNLEVTSLGDHTRQHNVLDPQPRCSVTGRFTLSGRSNKPLSRAHRLDAGQDVEAAEAITIPPRSSAVVKTGLHIHVPPGFVGLLWSRSGLSVKHRIEVGAGCIDAGYTGEVMVHLYNHGDTQFSVSPGDRIAQLLTIPVSLTDYATTHTVDVEYVDELDATERGAKGLGSSGR